MRGHGVPGLRFAPSGLRTLWSMTPLALFSASGRLPPRPFAFAVTLVYVASFLSQALAAPPVTARAGLWPFAFAQILLTGIWCALHARRLRDAGRSTGTAAGIAVLYALAVALLVLVLAFFVPLDADAGEAGSGVGGLFVLLHLTSLLADASDLGLLGLVLVALVMVASIPVWLALGFSVWAGSRPSLPADASPAPD